MSGNNLVEISHVFIRAILDESNLGEREKLFQACFPENQKFQAQYNGEQLDTIILGVLEKSNQIVYHVSKNPFPMNWGLLKLEDFLNNNENWIKVDLKSFYLNQ